MQLRNLLQLLSKRHAHTINKIRFTYLAFRRLQICFQVTGSNFQSCACTSWKLRACYRHCIKCKSYFITHLQIFKQNFFLKKPIASVVASIANFYTKHDIFRYFINLYQCTCINVYCI